jgi:uncharacterized protein
MMKTAAALALFFALAAQAQAASPIAPGLYERSGHAVYVGIERELPDPAGNDFFDANTQHTGDLRSTKGLRLRCGLSEERRVIQTAQGRLGFSLYSAASQRRTTVILIHGNDPEAREMGFIIPYFACNGIDVVSYDQRGVGESTGNWFLNGPPQRAADVAAIYDAVRHDPRVDARRIGVWGFSNGGWTAPLVTLQRPTAFMILKSGPTESLVSNIDYEVTQEMRRHGFAAFVPHAIELWHTVESAIDGNVPWTDARRAYAAAAKQPWFQYSLMPQLGLAFPPSPAIVAGLKRLINYDPSSVLVRVTTPALALYGALDRKVDASDSATHLREYLTQAGNRNFTIKTYPHAGHLLIVSKNGYDPDLPQRYVPGYPQITIAWLTARGVIR